MIDAPIETGNIDDIEFVIRHDLIEYIDIDGNKIMIIDDDLPKGVI